METAKQHKREQKDQMRSARLGSISRRERMSSILWMTGFGLFLALLIGFIVWQIVRPLAGTKVEILERSPHLTAGQTTTYNSNPPTSGLHLADPEEWGVYEEPRVMERLVHNLEHGGILIYYNCKEVSCDQLKTQLKDIATRLGQRDPKVILAPLPTLDVRIAIAAWGWYDKMDIVDEERIVQFFEDHINQGPEKVLM